ncbi:hypothetical protein GPJ56_006122 [Histomonas meleagridis]|uniref:uncharacterized protein n=1 Tax=Histomonas meleagridis TaxID=135588 RepID=UPI003559A2A0|nr:hypothetical protein GPJ56_006122 [Histomonas meleagridis]KAH0806143.1 hypothetical protein GO595_001156 [Histomonas meleagridis]
MCFNKEFTLLFTILSVVIGACIFSGVGIWKKMHTEAKWRAHRISYCFFFFAFMEFLQFVQYLVIDKCDNIINNIWTQLGWYHICFQPLFSNFAFSALDPKNTKGERERTWKFILWYCFVSGVLMSLRMIIPQIYPKETQFFIPCNDSIEGVCGPITCSQTGLFHLKWTFKMLSPSYVFPSLSIHFLNMFIAPILMGQALGSIVLFMTGPFIAVFFNVHDGERASIWCFFSILETAITAMSQYLACRYSLKKTENKKKDE